LTNDQGIEQESLIISFLLSGDGHEEQTLVGDRKDKDLTGYERNLYLFHVR